MTERIAWIIAVALVGVMAFFGGRQVGLEAGQQSRIQAIQRFFAERGGSNEQAGQGVPLLPGGGRVLTGMIEQVQDDQLVLTTSNGSRVTVRLSGDVPVRKQVDGQRSDLSVGERIVVTGTRNGDTVDATGVLIGGLDEGRPRP